jgi:hypothetical protein
MGMVGTLHNILYPHRFLPYILQFFVLSYIFSRLLIICSEEGAHQYIKHLERDKALLTFLLLIQIYKAGDFLTMKVWKAKYVIDLIMCSFNSATLLSPSYCFFTALTN